MPRQKKPSLAEQAEALWPLGWEADDGDEGEDVGASVGAVQLRITRFDGVGASEYTASAYNNEQPLIDGDEFDTLEEVIEAMHEVVTDFYSTKVPALATGVGSKDVQAGLVERLMASKDFVEAERDIYREALGAIGYSNSGYSKAALISVARNAIEQANALALKPRGAT